MPPFALTDQSGTKVRSESLHGHALVVSFVFTRCTDACPLVTAQLARVQARAHAEGLGGRVRFVSITVDPVTDTPDVLRRYAQGFGIDLGTWQFFTGAPDEVERVVRAFGAAAQVTRERLTHGSLVVLVDAQGRIVQRRTDLELDADPLVAMLRELLG